MPNPHVSVHTPGGGSGIHKKGKIPETSPFGGERLTKPRRYAVKLKSSPGRMSMGKEPLPIVKPGDGGGSSASKGGGARKTSGDQSAP